MNNMRSQKGKKKTSIKKKLINKVVNKPLVYQSQIMIDVDWDGASFLEAATSTIEFEIKFVK